MKFLMVVILLALFGCSHQAPKQKKEFVTSPEIKDWKKELKDLVRQDALGEETCFQGAIEDWMVSLKMGPFSLNEEVVRLSSSFSLSEQCTPKGKKKDCPFSQIEQYLVILRANESSDEHKLVVKGKAFSVTQKKEGTITLKEDQGLYHLVRRPKLLEQRKVIKITRTCGAVGDS